MLSLSHGRIEARDTAALAMAPLSPRLNAICLRQMPALRVAQTGCQTGCKGMQNADRSLIPRLQEEEEEGGRDLPEFVDERPERVKQTQPFGPVTKSL